MKNFSIKIDSINELSNAVAQLLQQFGNHKVIAFFGKMGAGKTTIIKEICRQLGSRDVVSSPTFALVNEYHDSKGASIFHFDFYRINKIEEAYDLGYEEYFYGGGLCLIEWPEKIETLLPDDALIVNIEVNNDESRIVSIA